MKYALVFPNHVGAFEGTKGPIAGSLVAFAKARNIDMLFLTNCKNWDDYDALIYFHNRKPNIPATRAKVGWWLCDLRPPDQVVGTNGPGKLDYVFLCNRLFLDDFEDYYGAEAHHFPQCGNDMPMDRGRTLTGDAVFIGSVSNSSEPITVYLDSEGKIAGLTKQQVRDKECGNFAPRAATSSRRQSDRGYHCNRLPFLSLLQEHISVDIIKAEGTTVDSKWIYQRAPISLALSPPALGYTSNRLYNILSAKGFCLTMWFPEIEKIFENHKHLVWFRTPEEAVELAKFYLARPEARMKIQEAGYQEYLENHTVAHRIDGMLKIMSQ